MAVVELPEPAFAVEIVEQFKVAAENRLRPAGIGFGDICSIVSGFEFYVAVLNRQPVRRTRHGIIADTVIPADLLKERDQRMLGILQEVSVDILGIDRNTALGVFGSTGQAESDARELKHGAIFEVIWACPLPKPNNSRNKQRNLRIAQEN